MNLAFIGLGTMGLPMAQNLMNAGYNIKVWNRSLKSDKDLGELKKYLKSSLEEVVEDVDVLITMLSDDEAVKNIIIDSGLITQLKPNTIHINMATISVSLAEYLSAIHSDYKLHYVSAPVLGRSDVAQTGTLNILVAGNKNIIESIQPIFDILGRKTWNYGELPEQANSVKLAVNYMIASAIGTMGEASTLVESYNINKKEFIDLITSTIFSSSVYKGYGEAIANQYFEPAGFKLFLGLKDVNLTLQAAEKNNIPMSIASVLRNYHLESLAHKEGNYDWSALYLTNARHAGK